MLIVRRQRRPVFHPIFASLHVQTAQIGVGRNIFGTQSTAFFKDFPSFVQVFFAQHPPQDDSHFIDVSDDGEKRFKLLVATKRIVDMIRSNSPFLLANRHNIDALAVVERNLPTIFGNARNHVVSRERPTLADATVFDPNILIFSRERGRFLGILLKNRGMRLSRVVKNLALVIDEVLNRQHRRNQLARSAEMIEFAARQGQNRHFQLRKFVVAEGRLGAEAASEFGIEVVLLN